MLKSLKWSGTGWCLRVLLGSDKGAAACFRGRSAPSRWPAEPHGPVPHVIRTENKRVGTACGRSRFPPRPGPAQRDNRHSDVVAARQSRPGQVGLVSTKGVQLDVDTAQVPSPQQLFHRPIGAAQGKGGGVRRVGRSEPGPEQRTEPPLLVRRPELSFWVPPQKKGHREEDVFKI